MKMTPERRALDKIFRRRDRYDIPDWQREEVWDTAKKQRLIDSILRGWKLPKFYFVKTSNEEYEVVDGQQRLSAVFEFCSNELALSPESAQHFGGSLSDSDYLIFQQSVNANVKGGAKTWHQILLRKLFRLSPTLADAFDPSIVAESGVSGRIGELGESIAQLIDQLNKKYAATRGEDLFKATNKTAQALLHIRKPAGSANEYKALIDDLYFLFRESVGSRLEGKWPSSFVDVNDLRTDLRHDVDHGDAGKVRSKRRRIGKTFGKYAGSGTPDTIEPAKLPLVQSNIMSAVEGDLRALLASAT